MESKPCFIRNDSRYYNGYLVFPMVSPPGEREYYNRGNGRT